MVENMIIRGETESDSPAQQYNLDNILDCLNTLTPREREILSQVLSGWLNKQIASELGISIRTVKAHRARVMQKMEADSLAELVTMIVTLRQRRLKRRETLQEELRCPCPLATYTAKIRNIDHISRSLTPERTGLITYDARDPNTKFPPIEQLRPPKGAPNVLLILIDDVGFGAPSAFGGPCQTPNAEKLAASGLKYIRFRTTALCSPTRAALLTGRQFQQRTTINVFQMGTDRSRLGRRSARRRSDGDPVRGGFGSQAPSVCIAQENRSTMKNVSMQMSWMTLICCLFWAVLISLTINAANAAELAADPETKSAEELAKETQNPVANLISVPFQNNFNFGFGPNDVTQWVLNVQPVIPISLTKDWNLITRTIMPIINQPSPAPGIPSAFGLGDMNPSLFLSPANAGKLIWGLGPTLTFPTASASVLGNGKWEAGPALVLLTMPGHWVIGALANNQWSYAGWGKNNVNALLVQPFINYNFPDGWYVSTSPIITANWLAGSDNRWTLPIGGGVGKILKFGDKFPPTNLQLQAFDNVVRPHQGGADWQLRFQVQFLFPR